ncbi:MAG: hypothetical protein ACI4SJ_03145 [Candidatus Avispirillum sp.]
MRPLRGGMRRKLVEISAHSIFGGFQVKNYFELLVRANFRKGRMQG